jgi:hypothetical protein
LRQRNHEPADPGTGEFLDHSSQTGTSEALSHEPCVEFAAFVVAGKQIREQIIRCVSLQDVLGGAPLVIGENSADHENSVHLPVLPTFASSRSHCTSPLERPRRQLFIRRACWLYCCMISLLHMKLMPKPLESSTYQRLAGLKLQGTRDTGCLHLVIQLPGVRSGYLLISDRHAPWCSSLHFASILAGVSARPPCILSCYFDSPSAAIYETTLHCETISG